MSGFVQFYSKKLPNGVELGEPEEDLNLLAKRTTDSISDPTKSKCTLVSLGYLDDEGKSRSPPSSKGFYFECKVETCFSGYIPSLALGFSTVGADPSAEEFEFPRRACDMEETLMVGYTGKIYWSGMMGRSGVSVDWDPAKHIFTRGADILGILLSPDCSRIELFHNGVSVINYDFKAAMAAGAGNTNDGNGNGASEPLDYDEIQKTLLDTSKPLYGVIDIFGGPQQIRLYPEATEPTGPRKSRIPTDRTSMNMDGEEDGEGGEGEE